MQFPSPEILLSIRNLSLAARQLIDPYLSGINKSRVKGQGQEFSQYRSYQPGDDLRWMDWKMYARSDRYYVRESEMDTSVHVRIMIDASGSMNYAEKGIRKIDYARLLAGALGYLAYRQGDAIGLSVFHEGRYESIPSRNDSRHLARFFYQLEQLEAGGVFVPQNQYKPLLNRLPKKELIIFITDLYQAGDELLKLLHELTAGRHESIVFHLMGPAELNMDFSGYATVRDLETGETVEYGGADAAKKAALLLDDYITDTRNRILEKNISYRLLPIDQPLNEAITDFLKQRQKSSA
ncbi:MAG: DUF58 domain-containing protein [Flavihumibacter sp.]